jgi:hypothetical protein
LLFEQTKMRLNIVSLAYLLSAKETIPTTNGFLNEEVSNVVSFGKNPWSGKKESPLRVLHPIPLSTWTFIEYLKSRVSSFFWQSNKKCCLQTKNERQCLPRDFFSRMTEKLIKLTNIVQVRRRKREEKNRKQIALNGDFSFFEKERRTIFWRFRSRHDEVSFALLQYVIPRFPSDTRNTMSVFLRKRDRRTEE